MDGALRMFLQNCRIIFHIYVLAVEGEEVAMEDDTDALQQASVDALPLEDIVHIGAVAVQFACKPCHPALLALEFCPDFFAYVYRHCFVSVATERLLDNINPLLDSFGQEGVSCIYRSDVVMIHY